RPVDRPDQQRQSGRRQHAGVRQANQPSRDDRPGRVPGGPAAAGCATRRAGHPPDGRQAVPVSPTLDAALRSWPFDPWLLAGLVLIASVYLRGWRKCAMLSRPSGGDSEGRPRGGRESMPPRRGRWHGGHLAAFLGGLAVIYLALASPIEPFPHLPPPGPQV